MKTKSSDAAVASRTGVRKVRIDADQAGQRVDNFLRRMMPGLPKGRLYRMLRRGEVRVNSGRIRAEYRLQAGDEVRIPPAVLRSPGEPPTDREAAAILDTVLFEDGGLLVINKPAGLAVHGGSGVSHGAIERLKAARPELRDLALAHRIDRETSGCLVLAKRRSVLRHLHARFRDGEVSKNYLALAYGDWQFGDIEIDRPLTVTHRQGGERHVVVSDNGKPSVTRVRLSRGSRHYSLLQCEPKTGRTHQLRVHLAHVGHAIAGDERYADSGQVETSRRQGLKRLFLHAQSIAFEDERGNEQHFVAPLPEELERFLAVMPG